MHYDHSHLRCEHEPLTKKWLEEGPPAHQNLTATIWNGAFLMDIRHLSTSVQTFAVKLFHCTNTQFAPKSTVLDIQAWWREHALLHLTATKTPEDKKQKAAVVAPVKESCSYFAQLLECLI